ncbi:hypothetical protein ELY33_06995 [Vreelandella andesensis]|uniref:Carboxypeptidase regulatory-like domain-containing protein n=1 Tax=Vreelandella andesensis TaxID=447567 RepID=A0A433KR03_9GAMM|nr:carboxypeptidase-like regulatory domain-containing protein [Halomonas andesensis]RUR31953.1 hypothetical protein ELY33_06995 [Halomonas andesensis]
MTNEVKHVIQGWAKRIAKGCGCVLLLLAAPPYSLANDSTYPLSWADEVDSHNRLTTPNANRLRDDITLELAGLFINGNEQAMGIVHITLDDNTRRLPLDDLLPLLAIDSDAAGQSVKLTTPQGRVTLNPDEIYQYDSANYIKPSLLAERLSARITWNPSEFAWFIQLVWDANGNIATTSFETVEPDVLPPRFSLSRVRGEARFRHDNQEFQRWSFTELSGRAERATWQARHERSSQGLDRLTNYHFQTRSDNWASLIGHQQVSSHSLLPVMHLTGAQAAWSNRPDLLTHSGATQLFNDSLSPIRSYAGEGPPGGTAELLINGATIERQRISLDGLFEFTNIEIGAGLNQVEINLFEPFAPNTPVKTLDVSARTSQSILPSGATRLYAGFGQEGNPLDNQITSHDSGSVFNVRQALGASLTFEGAAQNSQHGNQTAAGIIAALGPLGIASASIAESNRKQATLITLEGDQNDWFWRASLRDSDDGFSRNTNVDQRDHYGQFGVRRPHWELALIGRERFGTSSHTSYVLPAARYRPTSSLTLTSRPDLAGDYQHEAHMIVQRNTRLRARHDSSANQLSLIHRWSSQWSSSASVSHSRHASQTQGSIGTRWQEQNPFGWVLNLNVLHGDNKAGFLMQAGRELIPGLRFRGEAARTPVHNHHSLPPQDTTASVVVAWDFGLTGGGLTRFGSSRPGRGSLGGQLNAPSNHFDLSDIAIRVNGQVRSRTDAHGRFNVANLEPGIYQVDLDQEGLPLALSAQNQVINAEVAAGAITSVAFDSEILLGAAGQITDRANKEGLSGVSVRIIDANEQPIAHANTNAFGYWRTDGLSPGDYQIEVHDGDKLMGQRPLRLVDEFVFQQDLEVSGS